MTGGSFYPGGHSTLRQRGSNFHGQENNGMTIDCGIYLAPLQCQDIRTMIEAVHVLDRQAGGIHADGCSETRK